MGIPCEISDVSRMIWRQTHGSDLVCKAQSTEVLHGAGLRSICLRVKGGAGLGIHQKTCNSAAAKFDS